MKKIKKILAAVMTLAMVLGMSMTTFASETAPYNAKITVNALSEQEATEVEIYQIVSLDATANNWVIAEWAGDYVTEANPYVVDWNGLKELLTGTNPPQNVRPYATAATTDTDGDGKYTTSVEFTVPVGAYLILAEGTHVRYNAMGANTYDDSKTYMASKDVPVTAKSSGYDTSKTSSDSFVGRGEEVTFTVTSTFPWYDPTLEAPEGGHKFYITDMPTGLDITELVSVTVGGTNVKENVDVTETTKLDGSTDTYKVDFSTLIGNDNANAGKTVVIEYKATVMTDAGYENTANSYIDGETAGEPGETKGATADITLTKYDQDEEVLNGAVFNVYKMTNEQYQELVKNNYDITKVEGTELLQFVSKTDASAGTMTLYQLAKEGEESADPDITATNGTLKVSGLDEGVYWFKEITAPSGYSINEEGAKVTVQPNMDNPETIDVNESFENVSLTAAVYDTKLSALPSTGGIGTTIFTIGGCVIMIAAAGLFFASRRKSSK